MSGTISRFGSVVPKDLHRSVQQIIYNLGGADKDEVVLRDGTQNLTGNLQCNGKRLVNIGAPVSASDATTKSAVDSVQTAANTAQTTADNAQTSADNAQTSANTAQTTADNAQTSANTAQTTADNAQTSADNAQTTADNAQTSASTAQTTANTAQTSANTAQTTASNAQTSADNANTNANLRLLKSGDSMSGSINMSGNLIAGLPQATANGEAVEFSQLQTAVSDKPPTTEGLAEANKNLVCDSNTSITGLSSLGVAGCNITEVPGSGGADYELKLYENTLINSGTTTGLSSVVHQGPSRNTAVTAGNNWYPSELTQRYLLLPHITRCLTLISKRVV